MLIGILIPRRRCHRTGKRLAIGFRDGVAHNHAVEVCSLASAGLRHRGDAVFIHLLFSLGERQSVGCACRSNRFATRQVGYRVRKCFGVEISAVDRSGRRLPRKADVAVVERRCARIDDGYRNVDADKHRYRCCDTLAAVLRVADHLIGVLSLHCSGIGIFQRFARRRVGYCGYDCRIACNLNRRDCAEGIASGSDSRGCETKCCAERTFSRCRCREFGDRSRGNCGCLCGYHHIVKVDATHIRVGATKKSDVVSAVGIHRDFRRAGNVGSVVAEHPVEF